MGDLDHFGDTAYPTQSGLERDNTPAGCKSRRAAPPCPAWPASRGARAHRADSRCVLPRLSAQFVLLLSALSCRRNRVRKLISPRSSQLVLDVYAPGRTPGTQCSATANDRRRTDSVIVPSEISCGVRRVRRAPMSTRCEIVRRVATPLCPLASARVVQTTSSAGAAGSVTTGSVTTGSTGSVSAGGCSTAGASTAGEIRAADT